MSGGGKRLAERIKICFFNTKSKDYIDKYIVKVFSKI